MRMVRSLLLFASLKCRKIMNENFGSLNPAVRRDLSEKLQIELSFLSLSTSSHFLFFVCVFVQVGFTIYGKIKALDVTLYSNTGNSLDLSAAVSHNSCAEAKAFLRDARLPDVTPFSRRLWLDATKFVCSYRDDLPLNLGKASAQ